MGAAAAEAALKEAVEGVEDLGGAKKAADGGVKPRLFGPEKKKTNLENSNAKIGDYK